MRERNPPSRVQRRDKSRGRERWKWGLIINGEIRERRQREIERGGGKPVSVERKREREESTERTL